MSAEDVVREVLRICFDRGTLDRFEVECEDDVDHLPDVELAAAADLLRMWHDGENCWDEVWTLTDAQVEADHVSSL